MLNVVMLNVIVLNATKLNVVMLCVVVPFYIIHKSSLGGFNSKGCV
jgi:hypothetical protein